MQRPFYDMDYSTDDDTEYENDDIVIYDDPDYYNAPAYSDKDEYYDEAEYYAEQVTDMILNKSITWTYHEFGSPEYGSQVSDTYGLGSVSQYYYLESDREDLYIGIEIIEYICVKNGSAEDKGNLCLTLQVTTPVLNIEFKFVLDDMPGYEDMSAKQIWKAYKDNPFLILADAAIKDYTSHYNTQGADLRKKHSYINNRLQKYRGLPVVQLGNELRTEMHYYEFHRCILCPRTRSFQLQKHNLLQ